MTIRKQKMIIEGGLVTQKECAAVIEAQHELQRQQRLKWFGKYKKQYNIIRPMLDYFEMGDNGVSSS